MLGFDHANSCFAFHLQNIIKKFQQNSEQIIKSSLSSIVAGVCVQVCMQAAEKRENLFTGEKLFQRVFFLLLPSPVAGETAIPTARSG